MKNFNMKDLLAAQQAITSLESGKSISPNSEEHKALTWAVVRLTDELLISKRPLKNKDLEYAREVATKYRTKKLIVPLQPDPFLEGIMAKLDQPNEEEPSEKPSTDKPCVECCYHNGSCCNCGSPE